VVRASPIINVTAGTANTTGGSQINYTNLGVKLKVTPRISANNYVNLRVVPEVSRVFETITRQVGSGDSGGTFEADVYDIRKMETAVMVPSGNTLVMGGMVQDDIRRGNSKVPVLGDIPGLGYAFRRDSKKRQQSNLIVFLTPTIVQDQDFQPTTTDFLKTPVPNKDSLEPDWNAWDSGKPKDWSKKTAEGSAAEFSDPAPHEELLRTEPNVTTRPPRWGWPFRIRGVVLPSLMVREDTQRAGGDSFVPNRTKRFFQAFQVLMQNAPHFLNRGGSPQT
jgi:hypothetical protein